MSTPLRTLCPQQRAEQGELHGTLKRNQIGATIVTVLITSQLASTDHHPGEQDDQRRNRRRSGVVEKRASKR
jgi:hypothetical protein